MFDFVSKSIVYFKKTVKSIYVIFLKIDEKLSDYNILLDKVAKKGILWSIAFLSIKNFNLTALCWYLTL